MLNGRAVDGSRCIYRCASRKPSCTRVLSQSIQIKVSKIWDRLLAGCLHALASFCAWEIIERRVSNTVSLKIYLLMRLLVSFLGRSECYVISTPHKHEFALS